MEKSGIYAPYCGAFAYDEDYFDYLVKYDNDMLSVKERLAPACTVVVNSQFLVAYRRETSVYSEALKYGYNVIPKCYGLLDTGAPDSLGVNRVQSLPGLKLEGRDVLVGFVDTGIDYRHPVFCRQAGGHRESRILAIWDQTREAYDFTEGQQSVFGYGAEYTKEDIDRALAAERPYEVVPSRDLNGHGTFLASVCCGSPYEGEQGAFTGVAPASDILVVRLKPAKQNLRDVFFIPEQAQCYSESDILLGVKYLVEKAVELKKALILCLGVGSNQGDHNGNTNLELYLEGLVNLRGICVVTAGGNELGAGGHVRGNDRISTADSPEDSLEVYVPEGQKGFSLELWGRAPSLLAVSVISPTGQKFSGLSPSQDSQAVTTFLYEGTTLFAENFVVENVSGDPLVLLRFLNPAAGIWTVLVTELGNSSGGFDAWLPMRAFLAEGLRFAGADPYVTLCAPANGRGSITVEGYSHYDKSLYVNASRGYTRKGRVKPDLVAPAVNVFGAFVGNGNALFTTRSGSSVAAACTAGVCALLMEWGLVRGNNYNLNTEIIRQMLVRGAKSVAELTYPNPAWGWGALDAYQVFEVMRNTYR